MSVFGTDRNPHTRADVGLLHNEERRRRMKVRTGINMPVYVPTQQDFARGETRGDRRSRRYRALESLLIAAVAGSMVLTLLVASLIAWPELISFLIVAAPTACLLSAGLLLLGFALGWWLR